MGSKPSSGPTLRKQSPPSKRCHGALRILATETRVAPIGRTLPVHSRKLWTPTLLAFDRHC